MSKFNLSSVYSKDNIYSVLKLLKVLIDTLDNYEFQPPIKDRDGNEIPNEWFSKLYNSIHGSYNGDIEVGKDAHIDGNINVDLDATIDGIIKLGSSAMFAYIGMGSGNGVPAIMHYRIDNGSVIVDSAIAFDTTGPILLSWSDLGNVTYANGVYTTAKPPEVIDLSLLTENKISGLYAAVNSLNAQVKNKQNKLYLHRLTLTSKSGDVSTIAKLNWYSTNSLVVDSLKDLTTLLKPSNEWTCGVTAINFDSSQGKLESTMINELLYANSVWRFATPMTKGAYPISSVSDSVTAVD